ncbi:MAG: hypothetical protein OJJ54_02075 [Pseudonocardia sp.]|nr:hypothetical protein [Pseudonocardia sp.]
MLDVGQSSVLDEAGLGTFVDRIAESGPDEATVAARTQISARIAAGDTPAGVRRVAEALAASVAVLPGQRRPSDEPDSLIPTVRSESLVILEDFTDTEVASAISALVAEGVRIAVTAADTARMDGVQASGSVVQALPTLTPAEQRRLRRLLATSTPGRRARAGQQVPPVDTLPAVDEVAELCRRAMHGPSAAGSGGAGRAALVHGLLEELDPQRLDAVTQVAGCAGRTLAALAPGRTWERELCSQLVHNRLRQDFESLVSDTAQASVAAERTRHTPPVSVLGPLPRDAGDLLRRYLDFLNTGGRSRNVFRAGIQRDVAPVLRRLRVDGVEPVDGEPVVLALEHIELAERLTRIDAGCRRLGLPAPRNGDELAQLADGLTRVASASRSVAALRHDVLFLHPESPLTVPDLDTAEIVAAAILDYSLHGSAAQAAIRLDDAARALVESVPAESAPAELWEAVGALRGRDADGYSTALGRLAMARRDIADEIEAVELLARLRDSCPGLAEDWARAAESGATGFGLVWPVPLEKLLTALPGTDTLDMVILLDAAELGVNRLMVSGAAPRLVAVASGARRSGTDTLLGVLTQAGAPVVRGRTPATGSGRVVHLPQARRPGASGPAVQAVGKRQAGA